MLISTYPRHRWTVVLAAAGALIFGSAVVPAAGATVAPLASTSAVTAATVVPLPAEALTPFVDPLIGSSKATMGWSYPAGQVPFGMVQIGPNTSGANSGYAYEDGMIRGFTLSHLQGVNPILPRVGPLEGGKTSWGQYAAAFSHDDETSEPGYYSVVVDSGDGNVTAELTATERVAVQRYTFPETDEANILFNPGEAQGTSRTDRSAVTIDQGAQTVTTFARISGRYTLATITRFDEPFTAHGTWENNAISDEVTTGSTSAGTVADGASSYPRTGGWVTFDTRGSHSRTVEAFTAMSYVDIAGAQANFAAEVTGKDFDDVHVAATAAWEAALDTIRVSDTGGTEARTVFYSALYRAFRAPNIGSDVDGRYLGFDRQVHNTAGDFTYYQNYSLWDTYRTQQQLLALIAPQESADMSYSLVNASQQAWAPRWAIANGDGNVMTGDPITPFLVSAWSQGLLSGARADEAYAVLRENADEVPPANIEANGRAANPYYIADGYVPLIPTATGKSHDHDLHYGGSATLEYALADASLSTMAAGLGHTADAARYAQRGQNFRAVWDVTTKSFRARTANGLFNVEADPAQAPGFHEGTAAQYAWLVQQDVPSLIDLMGGDAAASAQLDHFFAYDDLLADPAETARTKWVTEWEDYYGWDTYNPNNEPDTHAPWMYLWTGQPWKTADVTRAALTRYTTTPDGVPGNDDQGQMGAWAVAAAIGLFPIMPGADVWGISTPTFSQVEIALDTNFYVGASDRVTISAEGLSTNTRYISAATRDSAPLNRSYLTGDELRGTGEITYDLDDSGTTPGWATGANDRPGTIATSTDRATRLTVGVENGVFTAEPGQTLDAPAKVLLEGSAPGAGTAAVIGNSAVVAGPAATWHATPAGATEEVTVPVQLTVRSTTTPGTYPTTIVATDDAGHTATSTFDVVVPYASWLSSKFNATGVYPRGTALTGGGLDGGGYYLLRDLMDGFGLVPGKQQSVTFGSGANAKTLHYVLGLGAYGQDHLIPLEAMTTIDTIAGLAGASNLSLVGVGTGSAQTVPITVTYTDSTTTHTSVVLDDWCSDNMASGNVMLPRPQERGTPGGGAARAACGLVATKPIPLNSSKHVASISIPGNSAVHLFAIATDGEPAAVARTTPLAFLDGAQAPTAPVIGRTVSVANSAADWAPTSAVITQQWSLDGVDVPGATGLSYTIADSDLDRELTVRVTATTPGYLPGVRVRTARIQGKPFSATIPPQLFGNAIVGSTVSASAGSYSVSGTTVAYQWFRHGAAISGATASMLTLKPGDVSTTIAVEVTATRPGYEPFVTRLSTGSVAAGTIVVSAPPAISGAARVGDTLRLQPGTYTGGDAASTVAHQWYRGTQAIPGATATVYQLGAKDKGKKITVRSSVIRPGYSPLTVSSAPTVKVKKGKIKVKKQAKIKKKPKVGTKLKVTKGKYLPKKVTVKYQWLRDGKKIKKAKKKTYKVTTVDRGHKLRVKLVVKKPGYKKVKITTKKTRVVR